MTTKQFDPHCIIRKLAEAEWPCRICEGTSVTMTPEGEQANACKSCSDSTGYIAPFESLRVDCLCGCHADPQPADIDWEQVPHDCEPSCPGWVPEPNQKIACWQIVSEHHRIAEKLVWYQAHSHLGVNKTSEEAVLRAAEAWLSLYWP